MILLTRGSDFSISILNLNRKVYTSFISTTLTVLHESYKHIAFGSGKNNQFLGETMSKIFDKSYQWDAFMVFVEMILNSTFKRVTE